MSPRKTVRKFSPPTLPDVVEFETFRDVRGFYDVRNMTSENATCFNGNVSVRKFRIRIELVDEPVEVIGERLEKLWVECDNHHHRAPLEAKAAAIGYTFKGKFGEARK